MILASSAIGLGLAGAAYFSPVAWRYYYMQSVRKQLIKDRTLVLTYDDGPSAALTSELLDLLRSYDAKASFFLLGRNAQQYPNIAGRIVQEGHDVGCHSDQHLNAWKVLPWKAVTDIQAGYEKLSPWVRTDGMFRPPFGKITLPTYLTVRRRGASHWWWTIDAGDTRKALPRPEQVGEAVVEQGGGIVLMHDLDRSKERNDFVLETTAVLLEIAHRQSLKIRRLSDLCQ